MKRISVILGVLAGLVVAALLVAPALVPADRIKADVQAWVKMATGRDLLIEGKAAVAVLPALSIQLGNVSVANPAGYLAKDMVRLGGLDIRLKLLPLLRGRVEVDNFVLVDPAVELETDRQGRGNWAATPAAATAPGEAKSSSATAKLGLPPGMADLRLGDVRVVNGRLSYRDGRTGVVSVVDAVSAVVGLKSLDDPLTLKGAVRWNGQVVDMDLAVANPRAALDGGMSSAVVALSADPVRLDFKGTLGAKNGGAADGEVGLVMPSVRGLAAWVGAPIAAPGQNLGMLAIKGRLVATPGRVAFTNADMALDAIRAKGDVAVDTGAARPAIKAKLDVESLDVNPYLPPAAKPGDKGKASAPAAKPAVAKPASGWSDAVFDTQALKLADADVALTAGSLVVHTIRVGKSALKLVLKDGRLTADLAELALYQGGGKGRLVLDGSGAVLGLDASFALKGLAAEPFLTDATGFDRLSGVGAGDIQVTGRGRSQRELVSSLNGKGAVSFQNGAIKGVNLAEMLRNVTSAFADTGSAQKTDFAELSGTFSIASGVVKNTDLALRSPLIRVGGAGTADLPKRTLNYRVEPKVAATLQGQGATQDAAGLAVPVLVEGPWDNLSWRPDLAGMAKGKAASKAAALLGNVLKGVR